MTTRSDHEITDVHASYERDAVVLRGVDFRIRTAEIVTVLGPSGSGKSTLLRVIAGLHRADQGRVRIDGADVTMLPPERRRVGLVPQDGALFPHLDVAANVSYGLRGVSARRAATHPRVQELLRLVGMPELSKRLPHQLSGGQQQRVALARALAPDPLLMLLDEPFSALDAGLRTQLRTEVATLLRAQETSTLLITHDQEEALSISDRIALLHEGRLVQFADPATVYRRPANAWAARFVGDAVIVPVIDDDAGQRTLLGQVSPGAGTMAMFRPEQLVLGTEGVAGTVSAVSRFGHSALVHVAVPNVPNLVVRRADSGDVRPGDAVFVRAQEEGWVLPAERPGQRETTIFTK